MLFVIACLVWAILSLGIAFLSGWLPGVVIPERVYMAVFIPVFFLMMIAALSLMPKFSKRNATLLFVACLAVWVLLFVLDQAGNLPSKVVGVIGTLNLIVLAGLLGRALATGFKRPAELIPVCVVATAADLASFAAGPTEKLVAVLQDYYAGPMTAPPPLADYFLIKIPVWGFSDFMPLFGVSDVVLLVLLSAGAEKFKINDRFLKIPVSGLGLLFGLFLAHSTSLFMPGMPLMVLFFLPLVLLRSTEVRKITRSDIVYSIVFPAIIFLGVSI